MSQVAGYFRDKLKLTVHKIIFQVPVGEDQFAEVCQRYVNVKNSMFTLDKTHKYPFNAGDWKRQSKNRYIHYKDYNMVMDYGFYSAKKVVKPNGVVMQAKELAAALGAEVAAAVARGGQLQAGALIVVAVGVACLMGGLMLGYLGLPQLTGMHLVPNSVVVGSP